MRPDQSQRRLPPWTETNFRSALKQRHVRGRLWRNFFALSLVVAILTLAALFYNVINQAFGLVAVEEKIDPATLSSRPLDALSGAELVDILLEQQPNRLAVYIRDYLSDTPPADYPNLPLRDVLAGRTFPAEYADSTIREVPPEVQARILSDNLDQVQLFVLVEQFVVGLSVIDSWSLTESIFNRSAIEAEVANDYPDATLEFRSWLTPRFIVEPMSEEPALAGIRTAILGTIWVIVLTMIIALPIGIGAAIYLNEYAGTSWLNSLLETNIRNLAGVPSILYGLLGLAIFVRSLEGITQGRTVLAAALTMALVILPIIIINAQEALRAVPPSIREASYGLGATKWQTIWNKVLPSAVPGMMTGTILALSEAIGETSPLIIIGASTFILIDPNSVFSKFTVLPIQIYSWTNRPQEQFQVIAAAAIIVLFVLLLSLNFTAVYLRQRFQKKVRG